MAPTPSWTPLIAIAVVVLLAGGAAGAYLYVHSRPSGPPTTFTVGLGDNVTVNYIGVMGSGPEAGRVFDTSIYAVATDSIGYAKTLEFSLRGSAKNYTPLPVHVGSNTPRSGYSLGGQSYIQVVTGFWQGLIGLAGNATRTVIVPPALGYGPTNAACVATQPLTFTLPVVASMSLATFNQRYPGQNPTLGSQFADPHYRWPVLILSENSSFVTIENLPTAGWSASPGGWPIVVTSVASTANGTGVITLSNELSATSAGHILGHDYLGNGPCSSQSGGKFIITAVDPAAGTFTENFNQEVQGQTLIFIVTIVDIHEPTGLAA